MLLTKVFREEKERVVAGLKIRNYKEDELSVVDAIVGLDDERKLVQSILDEKRSQVNKLSDQIGELFKTGRGDEAKKLKEEALQIKETIKSEQEKMEKILPELTELLLSVPNLPNPLVPPGYSDEDNLVRQDWSGPLPSLHEGAVPHWELAGKYNIINFDLGVKLTGAGFPVFIGKGARLQRALISFFLSEGEKAGYLEYSPPLMVNESSARATGQLPDKEGQMYEVSDGFYMIPTAEVPITNIYRDVTINENDFPIKMMGYTPCFRREAGSYGKDVRGLNRVHQFDKIEIVRIAHPDSSYDTLEEMLEHVSGLLKKLELPYRIVTLCGGDLGQASALTYDFEVYSSAQSKWLEVSSVSNFETYQSNRLNLKYKDKDGNRHYVHTLNGSALALARIIAAILENNQTESGIMIPKVLQPYTGFDMI